MVRVQKDKGSLLRLGKVFCIFAYTKNGVSAPKKSFVKKQLISRTKGNRTWDFFL